jgi:hypothetical protein
MALTFSPHTVVVSGIAAGAPASWADVEVVGIHVPAGSRYGSCTLSFPRGYAFQGLPAEGDRLTVAIDGSRIFDGFAVGFPGQIATQSERVILRAVDARWRLAQRKIGDSDFGAFAVVGYRVVFNPGGAGNRNPAAESGGDYLFLSGPTAVAWTRKEILDRILKTYAAGLLSVNLAGLSAKWDEVSLNFVAYGMSVGEAISALARECGESWGVAPTSGADPAAIVSIKPGGSSPFVVALPEPLAGANASSYGAANAVVGLSGGSSIEESTDAVEVHTGSALYERTYSTAESAEDAGDNLLTEFTPEDSARFGKGYRANVGAYQANGLGLNLGAGSKPKPWMRKLLTRVKENGDYVAAGSAEELAGIGRPLRPEECVWITLNEERRRLVGGFELRLEEGELLTEHFVLLDSGTDTPEEAYVGVDDVSPVFVTVLTLAEEAVDVERQEATALLSGDHLTELVVRSDIQPMIRSKSDLPVWATTGSVVTMASAAPEYYRNHTADLEAYAIDLLNARRRRETTVRVRCWDLTAAVALGRKLEISPAATGLDVDTVVIDVFYDLAGGVDQIEITATNNLAGVMR